MKPIIFWFLFGAVFGGIPVWFLNNNYPIGDVRIKGFVPTIIVFGLYAMIISYIAQLLKNKITWNGSKRE